MLVDTKIVVLKQKRMAEPEPVVLSMEGRERRGSYKNGAMGVERFFFFCKTWINLKGVHVRQIPFISWSE